MTESYPFTHHPCWSENRTEVWERIHLPVAAACNVKCAFCDRSASVSCHGRRPGSADRLMSSGDAIGVAERELNRRANLHVVAIAGPGEPLANAATFEVLSGLLDRRPEVHFCLSTNGVLLEESVNELLDLGVDTLSVSMSTSIPETATAIYEWADVSGRRMTGLEMAKETILRQLAGIRCAADAGIHVKVNSVLIPEVNNGSIAALAEEISSAGAELHNIMPLVPCGSMMTLRSPTCEELEQARIEARRYIRQFSSCRQCRADVVGIPGADTILRRC